jgi:hypothetical protein
MSNLKVNGKIVNVLDVETGESKAGKEWKKQVFVIDTGAQFNPTIAFQVFGDEKIKTLKGFGKGQEVEVLFNVSSREFNGKWYHNLDAWAINEAKGEAKPELKDDLPF